MLLLYIHKNLIQLLKQQRTSTLQLQPDRPLVANFNVVGRALAWDSRLACLCLSRGSLTVLEPAGSSKTHHCGLIDKNMAGRGYDNQR